MNNSDNFSKKKHQYIRDFVKYKFTTIAMNIFSKTVTDLFSREGIDLKKAVDAHNACVAVTKQYKDSYAKKIKYVEAALDPKISQSVTLSNVYEKIEQQNKTLNNNIKGAKEQLAEMKRLKTLTITKVRQRTQTLAENNLYPYWNGRTLDPDEAADNEKTIKKSSKLIKTYS